MSHASPVIRGITIRITPLSGLLCGLIPVGTQARYTITLDEKPLGRRMEAHWQVCLMEEGRVHLDDLFPIVDKMFCSFDRENAVLSPDAGLVVLDIPRHRLAAPLHAEHLDRIRSRVAAALSQLPRASAAA